MTVLTAVLKVSNIFILQIAEGNAVPEKRCSWLECTIAKSWTGSSSKIDSYDLARILPILLESDYQMQC